MEQALLSEQKFTIIHQRNLSTELLEEQLIKKRFTVMARAQFLFAMTRTCAAERAAPRCVLRRNCRKAVKMSKDSVSPQCSSTVLSTF